ncbi:MAG: tRNA lysidine(34) synthetase TilS [Gammaproteobacteria bacterium]
MNSRTDREAEPGGARFSDAKPRTPTSAPSRPLSADALEAHLRTLLPPAPDSPAHWLLAFSGGLDSSVLLHLLSQIRPPHTHLKAVHVDHGLNPRSGMWAAHCADVCAGLGIELVIEQVDAGPEAGESPEAAARHARYAALTRHMESGSVLFTAHHMDDQAETLLIRLARGSGPHGLASMAPRRPFPPGTLIRPLLPWRRGELAAWAHRSCLKGWIDDPSNDDTTLRRNAVRHGVIPALEAAFPGAATTLARAAELQAETAGLLDALADMDLDTLDCRFHPRHGASIDRKALAALPTERATNALRRWFRGQDLGVPPRRRLRTALGILSEEPAHGRDDGAARVEWDGACLRRWRGRIHLHRLLAEDAYRHALVPGVDRSFTHPLGSLRWVERTGSLDAERLRLSAPSLIPARTARDLKPRGRPRQSVQELLRAADVPPWLRDGYPALVCGDELVALPGITVAEHWCVPDGEAGLMPDWDV